MLILACAICLNQVFGARAGNVEYYLTLNVYTILQFVFACLLIAQWTVLFNDFQKYKDDMLSDQGEIANLMTYIHQNDFKFIIGGIGSLGTSVSSD